MYAVILDGDFGGDGQVRAVLMGAQAYVETARCFDPYNQYWLAANTVERIGNREIDDCQFGNTYAAGVYRVTQ